MRRLLVSVLALMACTPSCCRSVAQPQSSPPSPAPASTTADSAPGVKPPRPPVAPEPAPPPSPSLPLAGGAELLGARIRGYFEDHVGRAIHVQVDKPHYQPGETIWFRVRDLHARDFAASAAAQLRVQLVGPRGSVVLERGMSAGPGSVHAQFDLPDGLEGGEYVLKAVGAGGATGERPVVVSTYEPPRLKKCLEFLRKAYGEGDEVAATLELKRPTGEPLRNHPVAAVVRLDGEDLPRVQTTTDAAGGAVVRFALPKTIRAGDGLLTVLVEDGGVTESISRSIPIVLRRLQLAFFPEGGRLVESLPSRLYFEAKNMLDKPADTAGRIVDDVGNAVAEFETYKNGLGRATFTPATGRTYHAEITRPAGVSEHYALPLAQKHGCVLRAYDDLDGQLQELRAAVRCTEARRVVVSAMLREMPLGAAEVSVPEGAPAIVYLKPPQPAVARATGLARITLFDHSLTPLAERLVFRNRRSGLRVDVAPDRAGYVPREKVTLNVRTSDAAGQPVSADVALSVVDDTVLSFADDKNAHLLSRMLLESELPGKIEEPNFYLDLSEEKSALALDLLAGTRGYRTFEWAPVMAVEPDPARRAQLRREAEERRLAQERRMERLRAFEFDDLAMMDGPADEGGGGGAFRRIPRPMAAAPMPRPAEPPPMPMKPPPPAGAKAMPMAQPMALEMPPRDRMDKDIGRRGLAERKRMLRLAEEIPVRVFPVPSWSPDDKGPRTDFRETIYWNPSVTTGKDGRASVSFPASDAVTSFRVLAEGAGAGAVGRGEAVFKSSLQFSLSVKLPVEVSSGDRLLVPVTLSNERDRALDVSVDASFGALLKQTSDPGRGGALAAGTRRSLYFGLDVTGVSGASEVRLRASAGGLSDEFARTLTVSPPGFPQTFQASGTASGSWKREIDIGEPIPGSVDATVTLYPGPVASMVQGLEGLLREPGGCFEQTSSSNYPNVMIMQYLRENDVQDAALLARSGKLLNTGYRRLVGYETPQKGYEWFGGAPAHEALTAYGLMEFADMKQVWGGVDDSMMVRTANWLKGRRDGKGGYLRDAKALDSFGRASPTVTDAYITWALARARTGGIDAEVEVQAALARSTDDAYLLALSTGTLLAVPARRDEGRAAAKRLAAMQDASGAWTKADHSITRSGGENLQIETTALASLALLEAGGHEMPVRKAVEWMNSHRGGFGQWGATQATVLALKAMTAYANSSRQTQTGGILEVKVNGKRAGEIAYDAGRRDAVRIAGFGALFAPGRNTLVVEHKGQPMPFSVAVEYRSLLPASSPKAAIGVETALERSAVKMGETVRLNATIANLTRTGQPMTIARVGIPGGLAFQTWQLKELREKGTVSFWETRPREVIVYLREMQPSERRTVPLDLVDAVPGTYSGPASSAYLYYTDEHKTWAAPVKVDIVP